MSNPKLRNFSGIKEPYPLGEFPKNFVHTIAGEISAYMALRRYDIEGKDWEQIFAKAIGAEWAPSVVGLDDILMSNISAAWGAKTIKNNKPFTAKKIRLISGRNSPAYSYDVSDVHSLDPKDLGALVVEIWNERVAALYQKYKTLRTVVLMKGIDLNQITVFEIPTIRFNPTEYIWSWNVNKNLIGTTQTGDSKFTWQPHGSQFTIHETVPEYALNIEIVPPKQINTQEILDNIGFDQSYYRVVPRG